MDRPDDAPAFRPTIGMLTTSLVDLYELQWQGALDAARAFDADLITFFGRSLRHPEKGQANAIYELVSADQLDGLVLWTTSLELFVGHARMTAFCRRFAPLPIVSVENDLPGATALLMDDRRGMFDAVAHLIEAHGATRIAFVRGSANHTGMRERYQGYLDALAAHGLEVDAALIPPAGAFEPQQASAAASRLLELLPGRIDAIAAANDDLALGVLTALEAHGLRSPDDIAVVGFDDHTNIVHHDLGLESIADDDTSATLRRAVNLSGTTLPLTTVRAPFYELGWNAVELLLARVRGEHVAEVVTLPTELVVRRSCGCFSPEVRQPPLGSGEASGSDRELHARLAEVLGESGRVLPADWGERLATAFGADLQGGSEAFLPVLDEFARASLRAGGTIESWWRALFALRAQSTRGPTSAEVAARAETLWLRVQMLMHELEKRLSGYEQLVAEKRGRIVREVGQRLITAPDVGSLADALAEELPRLGMPSCYLAAYDVEPGERSPRTRARALLAYEEGRRRELTAEEARFPSRELVPGGRPQRQQACSMVAAPLFFQDEQLGFVLFELGPRLGWIYESLQEQLSSALQASLLVERERAALAAAEDSQQELEAALDQREEAEVALRWAQAELEGRVAARTAELADANAVLREQIEERERLEAQLLQVQKLEAIGQLAGGIAHDFNNLLIVINGYSNLLLEHLEADDPAHADAEEINRAGERAARLTGQLLAFSRRQLIQARALSVNEVVEQTESMLRRLLGEDVELETALGPSLRTVTADRGQLEQVIVNLVVNARDAMPDGGRLTIETATVELDDVEARRTVDAEAGIYVALSVRDTGVGMDAETQARIFEPFFTTKPPGEGTGLGLATVFGIVRQSGGHVVVASSPGHGATFTVYLPATGEPAERPEPQRSAPSLSGSETILVVEDDPAVRGIACRFLEDYGYHVLEASRGHEALRLCERYGGPLDLVVTDVVMPGMSGRELAERLGPLLPETRVLYMSGHTDSETVRLKAAASKIHLLQKPFTADGLARKVRELLDAPQGS